MKALTLDQQERFKELYNKGYSAMMIFKELGQNYGFQFNLAASRMIRYRNKFGLPKRGTGFKPSVHATYETIQDIEERERRQMKNRSKNETEKPSRNSRRKRVGRSRI